MARTVVRKPLGSLVRRRSEGRGLDCSEGGDPGRPAIMLEQWPSCMPEGPAEFWTRPLLPLVEPSGCVIPAPIDAEADARTRRTGVTGRGPVAYRDGCSGARLVGLIVEFRCSLL